MSMVEVGYHAPVLGDQWAGGGPSIFSRQATLPGAAAPTFLEKLSANGTRPLCAKAGTGIHRSHNHGWCGLQA